MRDLEVGFSQIITEPTHFLGHSRSCTYLLFTSQTSNVMDYGVHVFLHSHCHHQIILEKFDLKVFLFTYKGTVWHFSQENFDPIKRAVYLSDWKSAPTDLDVN